MALKKSLEMAKLERQDWLVIMIMSLLCLLLLGGHFYAVRALNQQVRTALVEEESFMGNDVLRSLEGNIMVVESHLRSLVLFQKSDFEVQLEAVLKKVKDDVVAVRSAFYRNGDEELLKRFEHLVDEKIRFNRNVLDKYREGGPEQAIILLSGEEGIGLRDSIFAISDNLRQVHRAQMREYLGDKTSRNIWLKRLSWFSVLIIFILVPISILYLLKVIQKRKSEEANRRLAEQSRAEKQHELQQQLAFINDLYKNAPIGFHSVDQDGTIIEMNETELKWLGYTRDEVIGKMKMEQFYLQNTGDLQAEIERKVLLEGGYEAIQTGLRRKDGSIFEILSSARSVYDEKGRFIISRVAVMDYSERKRLEAELELALEAAERSAVLKEQFVANMSHEIRTPLNAILGFSNLLQRTNLSIDQHEFARNIQTSSENLLAIINDILDFSKIEAGMLHVEKVPFSLVSLLHSLENMFLIRAKDAHLDFQVSVDQSIPENLIGDPTRLTQILVNLLGNAFKFTVEGQIQLMVEADQSQGVSIVIRFVVRDTGIGIPADKIDKIFERFGQASADTSRKYGGTGLGLTITKQLVELQGGSISVASSVGKGTTFLVEIPYNLSPNTPDRIASGSALLKDFGNKNIVILVVEDNPMNQRILELLLDSQGIRHIHAANGKEALDLLKQETFDLILMDIQMPVLDGYKTSSAIRQELKLDIPIIATTAHAFAGEREKCMSYGMNDYIAKPINQNELFTLINRYTARKRVDTKGDLAIPNGLELDGVDQQYLQDVTRGKPEVMKEMAQLFISQSAIEMNLLDNALAVRDFKELAKAAHSMKSTAAYMGFNKNLGVALKDLESWANEIPPDEVKIGNGLQLVKRLKNKAIKFVDLHFIKNKSGIVSSNEELTKAADEPE